MRWFASFAVGLAAIALLEGSRSECAAQWLAAPPVSYGPAYSYPAYPAYSYPAPVVYGSYYAAPAYVPAYPTYYAPTYYAPAYVSYYYPRYYYRARYRGYYYWP